MKKVSLSVTYLSKATQRDLGRVRAIGKFEELLVNKYAPQATGRLAMAQELQRIVERIARREAKP